MAIIFSQRFGRARLPKRILFVSVGLALPLAAFACSGADVAAPRAIDSGPDAVPSAPSSWPRLDAAVPADLDASADGPFDAVQPLDALDAAETAAPPAFDCTGDVAATGDAGLDAASDAAGADASDAAPSALEAPSHLGCTGLYDDWSSKHVAPGNTEFAPAVPLWSDGAEKHRWVHLPAGTHIDTTDMDDWSFPIGTKFWKEFSFNGKRVETRLFWKSAPGAWTRTTYRWTDDGSDAVRLDAGYRSPDAGPSGYEIPSVDKCEECHQGRKDRVLGFEAVNLGLAGATGVTLAGLAASGLLSSPPAVTSLVVPEDSTGKAAAALGFLHSNCGMVCHNTNPSAYCNFQGMFLRLRYADLVKPNIQVTDLPSYQTTVNVAATFVGSGYSRISPGDASHSGIVYLMNHRDATSGKQMPPVDTHVVDTAAVDAVSAWVSALK